MCVVLLSLNHAPPLFSFFSLICFRSLSLSLSSLPHFTSLHFTCVKMSQLGVILQESLRSQREPSSTTILGLLTHQMDGAADALRDQDGPRRRRTLKDRLRFTGIGCCGAHWVFRMPNLALRDAQSQPHHHHHHQQQEEEETPLPRHHQQNQEVPASSGMNLAAALAAERQIRGAGEEGGEGGTTSRSGAWRVSLMRLLEETEEREKKEGEGGNDWVCCVCMGRKKGAAFIPCGHTYCRVCSRELWLNRGTCPLCNRSILEILDIF